MSDNHDLLNDNNMCSFEEHEAENVCSNKDAVAYRKCSFDDIKIKLEMNTISLSRRTSERM